MTVGSNCDVEKTTLRLEVPFKDAQTAQLALDVVRIDREPKRSTVDRVLSVGGKNNSSVIVDLSGPDLRGVRLSFNSMVDHLSLVQKTIAEFSLESFS